MVAKKWGKSVFKLELEETMWGSHQESTLNTGENCPLLDVIIWPKKKKSKKI